MVTGLGDNTCRVFFLDAGHKTIRTDLRRLVRADPGIDESAILTKALALGEGAWQRSHHGVYVIRLADFVRRDEKFVEENLRMRPDLSCFYVGATGLKPEERRAVHLSGGPKSNWYVYRSGPDVAQLVPELFQHYNPMPWEMAVLIEPYLAQRLRERGHGVWQK